MWLFPYLTWVSIVSIVALLIGMVILESTRESLLLSLALAAIVVGLGVWRYRKGSDAAASRDAGGRESAEDEDAVIGAGPAS
jgi:GABA permease